MESNSVTATVRLKGEEIKFTKLELHQCFFDHHRFIVTIDHKILGEKEVFADPEEKLKLIGEMLSIELMEGNNEGESYSFVGIVTDMKLSASAGVNGQIQLIGKSLTTKLERGKMLQTYSKTSLSEIFDEVIQGVGELETSNDPRYTEPVPFSFQYYESDWQYLRRLSKIYNETLFTDGFKLIFGKYEPETVELTYDFDLKEVELGSRLISNQFEWYYHEKDNEVMKKEVPFSEETFRGHAGKKSDELNLSKKPLVPAEAPVVTKGGLDTLTEAGKYAGVNEMIYLTGSTKIHKVSIGKLVDVKLPKEMGGITLGKYRVINISHYVNEVGVYENKFVSIPSQSDHIPFPDPEMPVAQPMQATCTDNYDEEQGTGRIQVQFHFEEKACYHWIRTMTPDAGSGVGPGRGYVAIPEKDDEVILGFMDGNPEKPFVMGSVFHKGNADALGGGKAGNHIMSITDKSGSSVVLNDEEGSVTIKDKQGSDSTITFDGKQNIHINAEQSILLTSGESSILMKADGTINITGVKVTILGSEFGKLLSGAAAFKAYSDADRALVKGQSIELNGTKSIDLTTKDAGIQSTNLKMNADTQADFTGGLIKINS